MGTLSPKTTISFNTDPEANGMSKDTLFENNQISFEICFSQKGRFTQKYCVELMQIHQQHFFCIAA